VSHSGGIKIPNLKLSQRKWSQDCAKLNFFSQDKSVLFYRFPPFLSSEKVCQKEDIRRSETRNLTHLDRSETISLC
jgi:hypothetical protein